MKILIAVFFIMSAPALYAQERISCGTAGEIRSDGCKLAYGLLRNLSIAQQRGQIPGSISLPDLENRLKSGVNIPDSANLPLPRQRMELYKALTGSGDSPNLNETGPSSTDGRKLESGTRGGNTDLPEDLWVWY